MRRTSGNKARPGRGWLVSCPAVTIAAVVVALTPWTAGPVSAQPLEIDHVFVFASPDAPEAAVLREAGFVVFPETSRHQGQGTASISVMFENAYLELIWIDDAEEFAAVGLGMAERRASEAGSPFGTGLRRTSPDAEIPFPTETYTNTWMTGMPPIEMVPWSGAVREPLIFVVPDMMSWDTTLGQVPQLAQFTEHDTGVGALTAVRLEGPGLPTESEAISALGELGVVEFVSGFEHVAHLTFDEGAQGETLDLRPSLPVVLHY